MFTAEARIAGGSNCCCCAPQLTCRSLIEETGLGDKKFSKHYPRGYLLFAEGQVPLGVYVLCEGRAKVTISSAEGRILVLRIAEHGELLGVNEVLTGQPYQATVEALDDCQVAFISRRALLEVLNSDRKACLRVAQYLGQTLSRVVEHSRLVLLSQSSTEKLARLLIKWCDEHGKPTPEGIRINCGLTHEELAQMIGSSRETVTRLLGDFKRKQVVTFPGNAIIVRNRKALESLARY